MILASSRNRWLICLPTRTATAPWPGWSSTLTVPWRLIPDGRYCGGDDHRLYRRRADAGDVQAPVDLGDCLYWDAPEDARAADQEAVDAGHRHGMLDLAKVLHVVIEDDDAALTVYQRAVDSGEAGLAGEAMIELTHLHLARDDARAAQGAYQRAIPARYGVARWPMCPGPLSTETKNRSGIALSPFNLNLRERGVTRGDAFGEFDAARLRRQRFTMD
jgi:hypothetical protein